MSKEHAEHHRKAAEHHEHAAKHHRLAAEHHEKAVTRRQGTTLTSPMVITCRPSIMHTRPQDYTRPNTHMRK